MHLQWYPGHMAKTKRLIQDNLKLVDVVLELLDARLPQSSTNPDLDGLLAAKPRLVLMNKSDLADPDVTARWERYYKARGRDTLPINSISGKGCEEIVPSIKSLIAAKIEHDRQRGITRPVRVMVVGIPNVGKSSLINRLTGRAGAKTGDRPGVTKGKQWLRLQDGVELLDMPGILWPKFEDQAIGMRLAFVGSIRDEIMDVEELACHLLEFLQKSYPELLKSRYKLDEIEGLAGYELLESLGRKRGFVISGGEIDTYRAANILLDEFRSAKIGHISLERPEGL